MTTSPAPTTNDQIVLPQLALDAVNNLPAAQSNAVKALAIPHFFDADIIGVLTGLAKEEDNELLTSLVGLPYVQPYNATQYVLFPLVRAVLLKSWAEDPASYTRHHQELASYFTTLSEHEPGWAHPARIEAIYHGIAADEKQGFRAFEGEFFRFLAFGQYDRCSILLNVVNELKDELGEQNRLWLKLYAGLLAEKLEKWDEAEENYRTIELAGGWPPDLKAILIGKRIELDKKKGSPEPPTSPAGEKTAPAEKSPSAEASFELGSEVQMLDDFYRQKQEEAKNSFNLGLIAASIGFVIICVGIVSAFFWSVEIGVVTSAAGIVSQVMASILFNQNKRAREGMDAAQKDLIRIRNLVRALQIVNSDLVSQPEKERHVNDILTLLIGMKQK